MKTATIDVYIPRGRRSGFVWDLRYQGKLIDASGSEGDATGQLIGAIKQARYFGFTHYRIGKRPPRHIGDKNLFGWLHRDHQERFNMKRAWFVDAWRVVSVATKKDMFQPWARTRTEARDTAKALGITILEVI